MDLTFLNYFYEKELKTIMDTGEVTETFEELCERIADKVDLYAFLITKLEFEEDFAKRTKEKWQDYERVLRARRERIQGAIKTVCLSREGMTLAGNEVEFKAYSSGRKTLRVVEEKAIPPTYFKETIVRELDKKMLMDDIELGLLKPETDAYQYKESISLRSKVKAPRNLEEKTDERPKKPRSSKKSVQPDPGGPQLS